MEGEAVERGAERLFESERARRERLEAAQRLRTGGRIAAAAKNRLPSFDRGSAGGLGHEHHVASCVSEILSPTTARIDLVKKHRTLHLHGVPHYWIVDPEHETLTVYRHHADGYVTAMTGGVGDVVRAEPFEAIDLVVAELFGHEA